MDFIELWTDENWRLWQNIAKVFSAQHQMAQKYE